MAVPLAMAHHGPETQSRPKVRIAVKKAKEFPNKKDLYVILQLGQEEKRTKHQNNPVGECSFTEVFTFDTYSDSLNVTVMDYDVITRDDLVGKTTLYLNTLGLERQRFSDWISVYDPKHREKPSCKLWLEIDLVGGQPKPQPPQAPPTTAPPSGDLLSIVVREARSINEGYPCDCVARITSGGRQLATTTNTRSTVHHIWNQEFRLDPRLGYFDVELIESVSNRSLGVSRINVSEYVNMGRCDRWFALHVQPPSQHKPQVLLSVYGLTQYAPTQWVPPAPAAPSYKMRVCIVDGKDLPFANTNSDAFASLEGVNYPARRSSSRKFNQTIQWNDAFDFDLRKHAIITLSVVAEVQDHRGNLVESEVVCSADIDLRKHSAQNHDVWIKMYDEDGERAGSVLVAFYDSHTPEYIPDKEEIDQLHRKIPQFNPAHAAHGPQSTLTSSALSSTRTSGDSFAERLDAADGVIDGKYYGRPIIKTAGPPLSDRRAVTRIVQDPVYEYSAPAIRTIEPVYEYRAPEPVYEYRAPVYSAPVDYVETIPPRYIDW